MFEPTMLEYLPYCGLYAYFQILMPSSLKAEYSDYLLMVGSIILMGYLSKLFVTNRPM